MNPEIKDYIDKIIREHTHDGNYSQRVNLFDLFGSIETVSAAPTEAPNNIFGQFKIYKNATTYRFYWYDFTNNEWRYATGT